MNFNFVEIKAIRQVADAVTYDIQVEEVHELIAEGVVAHNCIGMYHPHGDCLDGETLVYTLDGKLTPIREMLDKGNKWVLSYDEKTDTIVPAIAHSWRIGQLAKKTYKITLSDNSVVEATGNHQFFIKDKGWVKAENLLIGQEFVGGLLTDSEYPSVLTNTNTNKKLHELIGDYKYGRDDTEVYHHVNENTKDNRPKNLKVVDKSEHALIHGHYLDGLEQGRNTMFSGKNKAYRKAIRKKNSELLRIHNENLWLIKAIKITRAMLEDEVEVNESNYEIYRQHIYNGTKLETVLEKGLSLNDLIDYTDSWSLDTSEAIGHTKNLKKQSEGSSDNSEAILGSTLSKASSVVRYALRKEKFDDLGWTEYEFYRKKLCKLHGHGLGNISGRWFPKRSTLKNRLNAEKLPFYSLVQNLSPRHILLVTNVEVIEHTDKKPMYDFTVDKFENMLIATKSDEKGITLAVAHNSAVYEALVGMAGVRPKGSKNTWLRKNINEPLIEGRGNFGDHVDGAAAQRYCVVAGTKVMTERGLINIEDIPEWKSEAHADRALTTDKHAELINLQVTSDVRSQKAVKWINSGKHHVITIKTHCGYELTCTPNHPLLVLNSDLEFVWKEAGTLKAGDRVCMQRENQLFPSSGSSLPKYGLGKLAAYNQHDYQNFPTHMSEELAFILGVVMAEGFLGKYSLHIMNTNKTYFNKFIACWEKVFPEVKYSFGFRSPTEGREIDSKKRNAEFTANGIRLVEFFASLGLHSGSGDSYSREVPDVIFKSSKSEVSAFLLALFEGDGSVWTVDNTTSICYDTVSQDLATDIKQLLLNYFGIVSGDYRNNKLLISGESNIRRFAQYIGFVSKKKLKILKAGVQKYEEIASTAGISRNDMLPDELLIGVRDIWDASVIGHKKVVSESGTILALTGNGSRSSDVAGLTAAFRPQLSINKFNNYVDNCIEPLSKHFPSLYAKLNEIRDRNYFYAEISEVVKHRKKRWVFDLTVETSHAFVANGFVVHNTESKISTYGEKFLLDPDYLHPSVSDMVPNFSDDAVEPVILPAKIPNLLVNGSEGIAVGVASNIPSFTLDAVKKCAVLALQGKINEKLALKYLTNNFSFAYGGFAVDDSELPNLISNGQGQIILSPEFKEEGDAFVISSVCPRFNITKAREQILQIKNTASVKNETGDDGIRIVVRPLKSLSQTMKKVWMDKIKEVIQVKISYRMSATLRQSDGSVQFKNTSILDILKTWAEWRVQIEKKVIKFKAKNCNTELLKIQTLLIAIKNIDIIAEALKKEGTVKYQGKDIDATSAELMSKLKITEEQVEIILETKIRNLKKLEEHKLKKKEAELKAEINTLKADYKNPSPRIIADLESVKV